MSDIFFRSDHNVFIISLPKQQHNSNFFVWLAIQSSENARLLFSNSNSKKPNSKKPSVWNPIEELIVKMFFVFVSLRLFRFTVEFLVKLEFGNLIREIPFMLLLWHHVHAYYIYLYQYACWLLTTVLIWIRYRKRNLQICPFNTVSSSW